MNFFLPWTQKIEDLWFITKRLPAISIVWEKKTMVNGDQKLFGYPFSF